MTLRAHHLVLTLFAGAITLGSLAALTVNPSTAQAACATGTSVVITNPGTTTSTPQSGIITLKAQSTPTSASGLTFMLTTPAQKTVGEATLSGTQWVLGWDTRNQPNGTYQLMAMAHFGTATSLDCPSAQVPININNLPTQAPSLSGVITPATWQGVLGSSAPFSLDTIYTDQYGRLSHVSPAGVNWHSTLGAALPNGGSTTVFTAGAVGAGPLLADFGYSGLAATVSAQIKVTPVSGTISTAPTPTPTPVPAAANSTSNTSAPTPSPAPVSAADATRLAAMPTIFRPATATNSDPVVNIPTLSCLEKALGTVRFSEISSGKSSPTAAERKLSADCFSGPEPIPAVLAPVAPTTITDLATTTDFVSLGSIVNNTTTSKDGKTVKGLLLTGKGAPNTNVFIYFFSDPLVLRAQTDSQGNWKYVLDTPLKSGHHEVYAVAEKDAGNFVRTSAVPISIAAAASGSQDGSLVVDNKFSPQQIGFAAGAGVLVLAALGILFVMMRRRRHPAAPAADPVHSVSSSAPGAPGPLPGLIQPSAPAATPPTPPPAAEPAPTPSPAQAPAPVEPAPTPSSPVASAAPAAADLHGGPAPAAPTNTPSESPAPAASSEPAAPTPPPAPAAQPAPPTPADSKPAPDDPQA